MNDIKLSVWGIYEKYGEYSRVTFPSNIFNEVLKMKFSVSKDAKGNPVKVYRFSDGNVAIARDELQYSDLEKTQPVMQAGKDGKQYHQSRIQFYMKTAAAEAIQTNTPDEVEQFTDLDIG